MAGDPRRALPSRKPQFETQHEAQLTIGNRNCKESRQSNCTVSPAVDRTCRRRNNRKHRLCMRSQATIQYVADAGFTLRRPDEPPQQADPDLTRVLRLAECVVSGLCGGQDAAPPHALFQDGAGMSDSRAVGELVSALGDILPESRHVLPRHSLLGGASSASRFT
jgi:hypothetical protein